MKVGQWLRDGNIISQCIEIDSCYHNRINEHDLLKFNNIKSKYRLEMYKKVANTPQELIEVGDLVELDKKVIDIDYYNFNKNTVFEVFSVDIDGYFGWGNITNHSHIRNITKIYTKQGKDYICQWEVK